MCSRDFRRCVEEVSAPTLDCRRFRAIHSPASRIASKLLCAHAVPEPTAARSCQARDTTPHAWPLFNQSTGGDSVYICELHLLCPVSAVSAAQVMGDSDLGRPLGPQVAFPQCRYQLFLKVHPAKAAALDRNQIQEILWWVDRKSYWA